MRKVFECSKGSGIFKLRGAGERMMIKSYYKTNKGVRDFRFVYLTYDEVVQLRDSINQWLRDVDGRRNADTGSEEDYHADGSGD